MATGLRNLIGVHGQLFADPSPPPVATGFQVDNTIMEGRVVAPTVTSQVPSGHTLCVAVDCLLEWPCGELRMMVPRGP